MYEEEEYFFACPICGAEISMLIDLSVRRQRYIEDCEICCNPIEVAVTVERDQIAYFDVDRAQ